jgi:hypothetical protein
MTPLERQHRHRAGLSRKKTGSRGRRVAALNRARRAYVKQLYNAWLDVSRCAGDADILDGELARLNDGLAACMPTDAGFFAAPRIKD